MKISNLLAILAFSVISFACSMENDVINNDMEKMTNTTAGEAALNVQIAINNTGATKTTESVTPGENETIAATTKINDLYIILLKGTDVVTSKKVSMNNAEISSTTEISDCKFLVKAKANDIFKVVAIANSSIDFTTTDYNTYSAITAAIQGEADLTNLVKMGESNLTVSAVYPSTTDALANPNTANISLQQLAARVELAAFNVTDASFKHTLPANVTLNKVQLQNVHKSCLSKTDNNSLETLIGNSAEQTIGQKLYDAASNQFTELSDANKAVFYTFPSSADAQQKVQLFLSFNVGDKTYEKSYEIKHATNQSLVKSGYIYRLKINMTVNSDDVNMNLICYTYDWNYNQISVDFVENN